MTETALKVNSHRFELYRAYSIFGQFVKSCQIFLKLNSKRQYQRSGKENESRLAFTYVLHKTFTLQSCSGGDECTKKRGAQAKVLFCQSVDFCLDYEQSPTFPQGQQSERNARVKITPREKRRHAAGREKNFSLSPPRVAFSRVG